MFFKKCVLFFVIFCCVSKCFGQLFEGTKCLIEPFDTPGTCILIEHCQSAIEAIPRGERPQICSFRGRIPVVCCANDNLNVDKNNVANRIPDTDRTSETILIGTTKKPLETTSVPITTGSAVVNRQKTTATTPMPVETTKTSVVTEKITTLGPEKIPVKRLPAGEISRQKCLEWNKSSSPNSCKIQTSDLFFKNVAENGEFPHQALLGYDAADGRKIWKCTGALISEKFVVTAARCVKQNAEDGPNYVRLGDFTLKIPNGVELQEYGVEKMITHPEYQDPVTYNDIALIELREKAVFNDFVKPICLQTIHYVDRLDPALGKYVAINWDGSRVSKLGVTNADMKCSKIYEQSDELSTYLNMGIIPDLQICASPSVNETCQNTKNDLAGGAVQIPYPDVSCSYELVAITSNGIPCGSTISIPGIYTRISYYVEWIESVVWYN